MSAPVKHTPGPWTIEPQAKGGAGYWVEGPREDLNHYVALACGRDNRELETANARLIAAAPDMLAALKNLRWAASERDRKNRIRQFDEFMEAADAAIRRAEAGERS